MEPRLTGFDEREALACLGAEASEEVTAALELAWRQLETVAVPRVTYRIFDGPFDPRLEGVLQGEDIRGLLKDSRLVVVFAATLGAGVDALLARLQIVNMGQALCLDACASSAIENVCDNFCRDMGEEYGYLTDRFSPGYGDLPLEVQRRLAELLDLSHTIGVNLTPGGLMIPQKSVTAIFGVADIPQSMGVRGCGCCVLRETCQLRKEDKYCGTK